MLKDISSWENISYFTRSNLRRIDIGWIRSNKGRPQRVQSNSIVRFEYLFLCFGLLLMNSSSYLLKMAFPCRGENYKNKKSFSTKSNRNKYEKWKNRGPQIEEKTKIPWVDNPYHDVESKYKHNIVKHLNMCVGLEKKRNTVANNKACPVCISIKIWKTIL